MSTPTNPMEFQILARMLDGERPRHAGSALGIPDKRVQAWCRKWMQRGWYDYGVSLDTGWLNEDCQAEIRAFVNAGSPRKAFGGIDGE